MMCCPDVFEAPGLLFCDLLARAANGLAGGPSIERITNCSSPGPAPPAAAGPLRAGQSFFGGSSANRSSISDWTSARVGIWDPSRRARAEREDVGARVGVLALELLRRHVLEGARGSCPAPSAGSPCAVGSDVEAAGRRPPARIALRQPEVEQLHARLRQHHVARLQIAVHDALPVRLVERVGDLDADSAAPARAAAAPRRGGRPASRPRGTP